MIMNDLTKAEKSVGRYTIVPTIEDAEELQTQWLVERNKIEPECFKVIMRRCNQGWIVTENRVANFEA